MKKALIVFRKEWREILQNKLILYTILVPPILLAIIPLVMMYFLRNEPVDPEDLAMYSQFVAALPWLSPEEVVMYVLLNQFVLMFLMMPVVIPVTIASFSIIGEKEQRSLEPLLATPIRVTELLAGKTLAAVVPALLTTWVAFGIFLAGARFLATPALLRALLSPMWWLAFFVMAPLFCILSVAIGVVISSRVNDTRVAQQIGGLIVLPVVALAMLQTFGKVLYTTQTFALACVVLAAIDVLVIRVGSSLFQRETILTRWK
ncbi:MAG: ABC transporter permease subunit [Anaerolineales bacterium]